MIREDSAELIYSNPSLNLENDSNAFGFTSDAEVYANDEVKEVLETGE